MKELSFPSPEGFSAPEDSKPGEPFEVMATLTMGDGGTLTLNAIDGAPVAMDAESEDGEMEAAEVEIEPSSGDGFLMAIENGVSKGAKGSTSKG
jgi:hypothetical protein